MFNNFHGFHLVEELHKRNLERAAKRLNSKFFKFLAFYDNEYGYSKKVLELIQHMYSVDNE